MSKAFYSSTPPKLIASFHSRLTKRTVEVWNTTCIVTNFGPKVSSSALINPANPDLSGVSQFPYFPKGGPVPKNKPKSMYADWQPLGYVTSWGGMEVGSGMLYPVSVIDGLVHQLGGTKLAFECKFIQTLKGGCPTGQAVATTHGSDNLTRVYPRIIHTSPPFYNDVDSLQSLKRCYNSSFTLAFSFEDVQKVACPLIGAGARGFPYKDAIAIASSQVLEWQKHERDETKQYEQTIAFGIPDVTIATQLVDAIRM
jgi:O-acetyl-ADP-ribose deacetylase (regulator of RNase III)